MSVLAAIAVLALLIVVHELGHFTAARLQGIHVNRFSIGFGPILWKYQGAETEYALRAFPLGGFVGFPDDDPDSKIPENDPDLLGNRPILDRAIVISAGVIANLVFAYLVFVVQFGTVGVPESFNLQPGVVIPQVMSDRSPAAEAGIKAGDIIIAAEGQPLEGNENTIQKLIQIIQASPNQPVDLTIQRFDRELDVTVVPEAGPDGNAVIGVQLQPNGTVTYRRAKNPIEVLTMAAQEFQGMLERTIQGFATLLTNFSSMASQVAGPVKIVEQGAGLVSDNAASLFPFTAIISINLAIINILPLPALDGGQLAFLLIEALRGKPLPSRVQENVMQTGLFLLLGLGLFLIVRDTTQLEVFQQFRQ
ncbi:RIP metalloprotease RseP [Romeria aff. gracilis LEGE 07310]|uniref:Zinc metalloprotease n=1 Tax=Vasconcelosia minhoensis LEGE 07310 TaxID=915328 RepID=A0A8J7DQF3_9CYAN|nr:RIP metalloprotease RseP [Romeria gracilis]MBE9076474.1 RIP metalloprotease RseP [Romeria aff. gracilis LEGE 07310]